MGPQCYVYESMLMEYLRLAMAKAHYELLGDGEGFYGESPVFNVCSTRQIPLKPAAMNSPARWRTGCFSEFPGNCLSRSWEDWTWQ